MSTDHATLIWVEQLLIVSNQKIKNQKSKIKIKSEADKVYTVQKQNW